VIKEVVHLKDVSTEPRYQNVQIGVIKTNLQEEELYDDVRSTKGAVDSKEPRCQNVQIDVTKTTEIGSLQLADIRLNHNTEGQSTPGNPDTPGYRELMPREYMPLRREQASTLNPKETRPAKKDLAKLNNRRRRCNSKDTTENQFGVKER